MGYAITPRLTAYAGLDVVKQGNRSFGLEGTGGLSAKLAFSATAFGLGAGAEYFIRPGLAVDGGLSVGMGKFGSVRLDDDRVDLRTANSTTTRLSAGLSWYPGH